MSWRLFRVAYELLSPLHIGYHKIRNLQRTRYYIPARNLWAAATERLARSGFSLGSKSGANYREIGDWLKEHAAFSYFFVENGESVLNPAYTDEGLNYGSQPEAEFERRFLSGHVTTALEAASTSAEPGSLHEVEFIAPFEKNGVPVSVGGWIWLDEDGFDKLGNEKWLQWLGEFQVGGERRYGFGRMQIKGGFIETQNMPDGYHMISGQPRPQIRIAEAKPLLAHALAVSDLKISGMVEPVIGRETPDTSDRFGSVLTKAKVCWAPGSVVDEPCTFQIRPDGLWERV